MKKLLTIILAGLSVASTSLTASEWSHSSSATLVSQYIFRGVDVNDGNNALQADFNIEHGSGFSAGVWGSNYSDGSDRGLEIDFFASYSFAVNDDFSLSAGVNEYTYSGTTDRSTEWNANASYKNFSLTYYNDVDLDISYLSFDGEFAINEKNSFNFHYGDSDPDNGEGVVDYSIGISHQYNDDIAFFFTFTTTDADDALDENFFGGISISL